jgi:hypothetical protein
MPRSLDHAPIVRLILDPTVVRVRRDREATSISLRVVIGVRPESSAGEQEHGSESTRPEERHSADRSTGGLANARAAGLRKAIRNPGLA